MAVKSDPKTSRSEKAPELIEPKQLVCVACQTYDEGVKCASCQWNEFEQETEILKNKRNMH